MSLRVLLLVESGTDVRLVEGLAERFVLTVLARRIAGGREISHPPTVPVPLIVGSGSRLRFALSIVTYLLRHRAEIDRVIVQGYGLAALAANVIGRLTGIATFMLVCSPAEAYYACRRMHAEPGKPYRTRELLAIRALARLNAWMRRPYLVLSDHLADVVRAHGARSSISVTPVYGVDTFEFRPSGESKVAARRRLQLPEHGTLIVFSSRIAPEKDAETLLAAIDLLLREGRDLWVVHRSGGHEHFARAAARLGIAQRVIATGAVHPRDLPLDFQACDLCVQASREEGLGFSPLEALACEVPVVAAAVGGLRETILDGVTGWTYPVGDAPALAARIATVIDHPVEAARMAAAGRALVLERFERGYAFDAVQQTLEGASIVPITTGTRGAKMAADLPVPVERGA